MVSERIVRTAGPWPRQPFDPAEAEARMFALCDEVKAAVIDAGWDDLDRVRLDVEIPQNGTDFERNEYRLIVTAVRDARPPRTATCGCPRNEAGDIRCHVCREYANVRCWQCGTPRGDGPCPNPVTT